MRYILILLSEGSSDQPNQGCEHRDEAEPALHVALRLLEQVHLHRNHPLRHHHGKREWPFHPIFD